MFSAFLHCMQYCMSEMLNSRKESNDQRLHKQQSLADTCEKSCETPVEKNAALNTSNCTEQLHKNRR